MTKKQEPKRGRPDEGRERVSFRFKPETMLALERIVRAHGFRRTEAVERAIMKFDTSERRKKP